MTDERHGAEAPDSAEIEEGVISSRPGPSHFLGSRQRSRALGEHAAKIAQRMIHRKRSITVTLDIIPYSLDSPWLKSVLTISFCSGVTRRTLTTSNGNREFFHSLDHEHSSPSLWEPFLNLP